MTDEIKHHAYLFEAKGLQAFLGETGRLIDLIGGSNLIASVASGQSADDILSEVLGEIDPRGEHITLSRRAGAAFCLHSQQLDLLRRFRAAWRLRFGMQIPGLAFADVLMQGCQNPMTALRHAYRTQSGVRENGTQSLLPLARPCSILQPGTGRPTISHGEEKGDTALDRTVALIRSHGREIARGDSDDRLSRRFLIDDTALDFVFPRHFDIKDAGITNPAFPFPAEDQRIGIVHADISGLGQLFIRLVDTVTEPDAVMEVATAIEMVILDATRAATKTVLEPEAVPRRALNETWGQAEKQFGDIYGPGRKNDQLARVVPARPVLLGGDDLTMIVRADLALDFAATFLTELEHRSRITLIGLRKRFPEIKAEVLTACAGIAIVGTGHPYAMASDIAEGLCDSAKKECKAEVRESAEAEGGKNARPPVSALQFAVVTAAVGESYAEYRAREQMSAGGTPLTMGPYHVGGGDSLLPQWAALKTLALSLGRAQARGKLFDVLGQDGKVENPENDVKLRADRAYERFFDVLKTDDPAACEEVDANLCAVVGSAARPARVAAMPALADAMELMDFGAVRPMDQREDQ
jgi:hypothetical protein